MYRLTLCNVVLNLTQEPLHLVRQLVLAQHICASQLVRCMRIARVVPVCGALSFLSFAMHSQLQVEAE